jgi:alpha-1,2-mannosyltransferase
VVVAALVRAVRAHRNDQLLAAAVVIGAAGLVVSPVSWTHHQVWLVLAALLAVGARTRTSLWWAIGVVAVMTLPVTAVGAGLPGDAVFGNARLLLAVAVAAVVPFAAVRRPRAVTSASPSGGGAASVG